LGEALADFRAAVAVERPAAEYLHDLAWFRVRCPVATLRDAAEAKKLADQLTREVPANVNFLGTLGAAQVRAEEFALGAATLRRAIEARSPGDPRELMFLAVAEMKLKENDRARQSWKKAIDRLRELCPASVELRAIQREFAPLFSENR
jgi:uncharacterized protein HemY